MDKEINTLVIMFKNQLYHNEIPLFRGAVLSKVPREMDIFHNHQGDGLKYRYPMIQYKRIGQKAAIVCVGEGTRAIGNFFSATNLNFAVGRREDVFEIDTIKADRAIIQTWEDEFRYTIRKWIAFNQENYKQYQQIEGVVKQVEFMQRVLIGNILSMSSSLGVRFEKEVRCEITSVLAQNVLKYKNVPMTCFDVEFKTNVYLPDYIGLGKGVSQGYGMIKQIRKQ